MKPQRRKIEDLSGMNGYDKGFTGLEEWVVYVVGDYCSRVYFEPRHCGTLLGDYFESVRITG